MCVCLSLHYLPKNSELHLSHHSFFPCPTSIPHFSIFLSLSFSLYLSMFIEGQLCPSIVNSEMTLKCPLQLNYSHFCSLLFDLIH